ncbi:hypothetical protein MTES_3396 [Microbacterium testaceum StLB037]|uniref:MafI family immunity protein n=1 Tax=Microbacterium testaceum (strain StLB037) TaxID=979556 RepID=E8NEA6_MICTS|nr:MafI family immunity protein [Microbacterium testaceum]BAJ76360.1 hypothetical protein MTES_3396 [Microbacterium testaceum StLB037]
MTNETALWASNEIQKIAASLVDVLGQTVIDDVLELVSYSEPGIALDLLCDRISESEVSLSPDLRARIVATGSAMGLDSTVSFLVDPDETRP